jgi:uncharacterized protein
VSIAANLKSRTVKELADMARKQKVLGWHDMRKDDLVRVLLKQAKKAAAKPLRAGAAKNGVSVSRSTANGNSATSSNGHAKNGSSAKNGCQAKNGATVILTKASKQSVTASSAPIPLQVLKKQALLEKDLAAKAAISRTPQSERRLQQIKTRLAEAKDLAFRSVEDDHASPKDRLGRMVRDPYWLHVYWELGRRSIQRAQAAMGANWHAARPVLRLHEVSRNGTTSAARQAVRDIEIHGGVNNWYIDVQNPPKSYQVEIGYLAPGNRFYSLGRSNVVSTPAPGSADTFDRNWAEVAKECDRVYAMTAGSTEQEATGDLKDVFEEHMHRPMGDSLLTQFGPGAATSKQNFRFQIDTELIVHGVTHPDARVTLRGEPVRLRPDGSFAVRFSLPDRRHVLPVVANSGDGAEQRTIVLAIDRNTKVMEPVVRDPGE